jgi:hypothetical protein
MDKWDVLVKDHHAAYINRDDRTQPQSDGQQRDLNPACRHLGEVR